MIEHKRNYSDKSLFFIHNLKAPCLNCENRFLGCHSSCNNYQSFRKQLDIINTKRQERIGVV